MLPQEFLQRMHAQLGAEYPAFLQSLERPRAVALRFNPLKGKIPALDFVQEAVPWEPMGYYYDPQSRPGLHPFHEAGVYYLQEASAMSAAALLDPQPGERICDLCAAPGGKTTQIAGKMGGKGFLLSNEIHPKRAKILSRNVERMGISNALVTNTDPATLAKKYPGYFHRVLIDAPCSGEGMFRKEEAAVTDWSPETVAMCARRQSEILEAGSKLVCPGGRLVYSTCTFAPQENEEAVLSFLSAHPDFQPEDVEAPWFTRTAPGFYRLWPHKLLGEGHFVAVLRRQGQENPESYEEKGEKLPKEWLSFAKELGISLPPGRALTFGSRLFWAPEEMPDLAGVKAERPGLELGEVRKGRFIPAHALALWLRNCPCTQEYPPESPEIGRYLHGETLPTEKTGWCLITTGGYSIGWGKGDGKVMKNHYPKGIRR